MDSGSVEVNLAFVQKMQNFNFLEDLCSFNANFDDSNRRVPIEGENSQNLDLEAA